MEAAIKQRNGRIEEKLMKVIRGYNNTMHSGIKCIPIEAGEMESNTVAVENVINGKYADKFKKRYRETFTENQVIRIPKRDNLGADAKTDKGRFKNVGKIMYKCENDSYVVRT
ncbi:hypothetical protein NGRA_2555 [Nosema granulosis]|uniref:Uncharacterized protein n=1 Tax=Nosema granulosis TaxID=83296 RepID=A0A9P6GWV2_9MICR|nr:hypothetical protein NGRA_2555 [Nosema granulosis]